MQNQLIWRLLLIFSVAIFDQNLVANGQRYDYDGKRAAPAAPTRKMTASCGQTCEAYNCVAPTGCTAGIVMDKCDCCMVCGKPEGSQCDVEVVNDNKGYFARPTYAPVHGRCGENMECVLLMDYELSKSITDNAICQCRDQRPVCGDDGRTYANKCKFYETMANRRDAHNTQIARFEPCDEAPTILVPPQNLVEEEGKEITLSCEVGGYPPPKVEWTMGKDGSKIVLPGDDLKKSVQARGGPEHFQVTSWLKIQNFSLDDEGTYLCVAKNRLGRVTAASEVRIQAAKKKVFWDL